LLKYYRIN